MYDKALGLYILHAGTRRIPRRINNLLNPSQLAQHSQYLYGVGIGVSEIDRGVK